MMTVMFVVEMVSLLELVTVVVTNSIVWAFVVVKLREIQSVEYVVDLVLEEIKINATAKVKFGVVQ